MPQPTCTDPQRDPIDEIDPVLRDARLIADLLAAAGDDDHVDCELVRRTGHALRWRLRDIEEILSRANDRRRQQALARGAA